MPMFLLREATAAEYFCVACSYADASSVLSAQGSMRVIRVYAYLAFCVDQLHTRVARPLTRKGLRRQWQAVTIKQDVTPAYIDEFIALLSRPAMPLGKPAIVRFVSNK